MRFLVTKAAVLSVCCVLATGGALPVEEDPDFSSVSRSNGLTPFEAPRSNGLSATILEKRGIITSIIKIGASFISNRYPLALGYSIITSLYSTTENCATNGATFDCFFGAFDVASQVYCAEFSPSSGKVKARDGSLAIERHNVLALTGGRSMVARIPLTHCTLSRSAMAQNNSSWTHIATAYQGDSETHHAWYRQAVEEDLGSPDDGTYHHLRVQPASSPSLMGREETSENGLVLDYLWNNGDEVRRDQYVDLINEEDDTNYVGSESADWMEKHNSEASCHDTGYATCDNSQRWIVDNGVVADGWNYQPFAFNGRSDGWISDCASL